MKCVTEKVVCTQESTDALVDEAEALRMELSMKLKHYINLLARIDQDSTARLPPHKLIAQAIRSLF